LLLVVREGCSGPDLLAGAVGFGAWGLEGSQIGGPNGFPIGTQVTARNSTAGFALDLYCQLWRARTPAVSDVLQVTTGGAAPFCELIPLRNG